MKNSFFKYEPSCIKLKTKIKCFCLDDGNEILYLGGDDGILYSADWSEESVIEAFSLLPSTSSSSYSKSTEENYLNQVINLHYTKDALIAQLRGGVIYFISLCKDTRKFIKIDSFINTESIGFTKFLYLNISGKEVILYAGNENSEIKAYNKSSNTYHGSVLSKSISFDKDKDNDLGVVTVIKKINESTVLVGLECSSLFIVSLSFMSQPKVKASKFTSKLDNESILFDILDYLTTPIDIGGVLLDSALIRHKEEKESLISIFLSFYSHDICILSYNSVTNKLSKDYFIIKDSFYSLKSGIPALEVVEINSVTYLISGGYDYRIRVYRINTLPNTDNTISHSADLTEWTQTNKSSINKLKAVSKDKKHTYLIVCAEDNLINIYKHKS